MNFYEYQDIINGEGTIYILKAKTKKEAIEKLKKICPFGWYINKLVKMKWWEVINKDILIIFTKGILREDIYQNI